MSRKEWIEEVKRKGPNRADSRLSASVQELEMAVCAGTGAEGEFSLDAGGRAIEGRVFSSRLAVRVQTPHFSGVSPRIRFAVDAAVLDPGQELCGVFGIVTDCGELTLPFRIQVQAPALPRELSEEEGGTRSDRFAELARVNPERALEIFSAPDFVYLLDAGKERTLYRALTRSGASAGAMQEFLRALCGSAPAALRAEPQELELDLTDFPLGKLRGTRQLQVSLLAGEGDAPELTVKAQGDFLQAELCAAEPKSGEEAAQEEGAGSDTGSGEQEETVPEEDTSENEKEESGSCQGMPVACVRCTVDLSRLHAAHNEGILVISGGGSELQIPVRVKCRGAMTMQGQRDLEHRRLVCAMTDALIAFCAGRLSKEEWLSAEQESISALERLMPGSEEPLLYQAHLCLLQGQKKEAIRDLRSLISRLQRSLSPENPNRGLRRFPAEDVDLYCYRIYLILRASGLPEVKRAVLGNLRRRFTRRPDDWRIAWLLLEVDPKYREDAARWELIRTLWERGARSPLLYLEAVRLVPGHVSGITPAEEGFVIALLSFALRRGMNGSAAVAAAVKVADQHRDWSPAIARTLQGQLGRETDEERKRALARALSTQLMKHEDYGERAFAVYDLALSLHVRMTGLAGAWMRACPGGEVRDLPEAILQSFSDRSMIRFSQKAWIYRCLYTCRERHEELWEKKKGELQDFLLRQLPMGRVSPDLVFLLRQCLPDPPGEDRENYVRILRAVQVRCDDPSIRAVLVADERLCGTREYPLDRGHCPVPLFGPRQHLLAVDRQGRRLAADGLLQIGAPAADWTIPADWELKDPAARLEQSGFEERGVDADNAAACEALAADGALSEEFRMELLGQLLSWEQEQGREEQLRRLLEQAGPALLSPEGRARVLRGMLEGGRTQEALSYLLAGTAQGLPDELIGEVVERSLAGEREVTGELRTLLWYGFLRGLRSPRLVHALCVAGGGLLAWRGQLWEFAAAEDLPVLAISLARQSLTSGVPCSGRVIAQLPPGELRDLAVRQHCDDAFHRGVLIESGVAAELCGRLLGREPQGESGARRTESPAPVPVTTNLMAPQKEKQEERPEERPQEEGTDAESAQRLLRPEPAPVRERAQVRPLSDIEALALLEWMALSGQRVDGPKRAAAEEIFDALCRRGIIFPFFSHLAAWADRTQAWVDQTFLELRVPPEHAWQKIEPVLHLTFPSGAVRELAMREVIPGAFTACVLLFAGEEVPVVITDRADGNREVTRGTVRAVPLLENGNGRLQALAQVSRSLQSGQTGQALEQMDAYQREDALVRALFARGGRERRS